MFYNFMGITFMKQCTILLELPWYVNIWIHEPIWNTCLGKESNRISFGVKKN